MTHLNSRVARIVAGLAVVTAFAVAPMAAQAADTDATGTTGRAGELDEHRPDDRIAEHDADRRLADRRRRMSAPGASRTPGAPTSATTSPSPPPHRPSVSVAAAPVRAASLTLTKSTQPPCAGNSAPQGPTPSAGATMVLGASAASIAGAASDRRAGRVGVRGGCQPTASSVVIPGDAKAGAYSSTLTYTASPLASSTHDHAPRNHDVRTSSADRGRGPAGLAGARRIRGGAGVGRTRARRSEGRDLRPLGGRPVRRPAPARRSRSHGSRRGPRAQPLAPADRRAPAARRHRQRDERQRRLHHRAALRRRPLGPARRDHRPPGAEGVAQGRLLRPHPGRHPRRLALRRHRRLRRRRRDGRRPRPQAQEQGHVLQDLPHHPPGAADHAAPARARSRASSRCAR